MLTPAVIKKASEVVKKKLTQYQNVLVVVSAMGKQTNQLLQLIKTCGSDPVSADFTLSTGENVSAGLLSACLNEQNISSIPLSGWQVPIQVTNKQITNIPLENLQKILKKKQVPIIAGFQGIEMIDGMSYIRTLTRGGSDTSAIALACALDCACEIYTDVPGIFTADPNIVSDAKHLPEVSYEALKALTEAGAKVVNADAANLAYKNQIELKIRSTFMPELPGTTITKTHTPITCIAHKEIIGIRCKTDEIFPNALYYTYDPKTKNFLGLFETEDYPQNQKQIKMHFNTFTAYKISLIHSFKQQISLHQALKNLPILHIQDNCVLVESAHLKPALFTLHALFTQP